MRLVNVLAAAACLAIFAPRAQATLIIPYCEECIWTGDIWNCSTQCYAQSPTCRADRCEALGLFCQEFGDCTSPNDMRFPSIAFDDAMLAHMATVRPRLAQVLAATKQLKGGITSATSRLKLVEEAADGSLRPVSYELVLHLSSARTPTAVELRAVTPFSDDAGGPILMPITRNADGAPIAAAWYDASPAKHERVTR